MASSTVGRLSPAASASRDSHEVLGGYSIQVAQQSCEAVELFLLAALTAPAARFGQALVDLDHRW